MRERIEIKESFLFKVSVSGMGTSLGLASMFALFHDNLSFSKDWLSTIDLALAFCVVLFFARSLIELKKFMETLKKYTEEQLQNHVSEEQPGIYPLTTFKKAVVWLFLAMVLCFAALLLTTMSPPLISAAVVSFVLIAAVVEIIVASAINSSRN